MRGQNKVFLIFLFYCLSIDQAISLHCYISSIPFVLQYNVTIDTLPSFANNTLVTTNGFCSLTVLWLRVQPSSMIIFGYDVESIGYDSLTARVQYQLGGAAIDVDQSRTIEYRCKSADGCNNGTNLERILRSLYLREDFSPRFDTFLALNASFNNESIDHCLFYKNTTDQCPPKDVNCLQCQITMNVIKSMNSEICATCPPTVNDGNLIQRYITYDLINRTIIADQTLIGCQSSNQCNSLTNIDQVLQYNSIQFSFEKFSPQTSSSPRLQLFVGQPFNLFIFIFILLLKFE